MTGEEAELSASFVVGNACGLGGPGIPGGKGQDDQRDQVRQHVVNNPRHMQGHQKIKAGIHIAQGPAEAKEQGG